MLYKLYSSGGAWLDARTLYNALQHVRREGGCEEVREDMVPQHHPAYSAPPDTSQHHPTPPGSPMLLASRTSSHLPSRRTCCRALYSVRGSNHAPPELYSLYSIIQHYTALYSVVYYTAIQLIHYIALYNHPLIWRSHAPMKSSPVRPV